MSFEFPNSGAKKEAASDPVGEIEHVAAVLEAEEKRRGLKVPEGGPELRVVVQKILAEQEDA